MLAGGTLMEIWFGHANVLGDTPVELRVAVKKQYKKHAQNLKPDDKIEVWHADRLPWMDAVESTFELLEKDAGLKLDVMLTSLEFTHEVKEYVYVKLIGSTKSP